MQWLYSKLTNKKTFETIQSLVFFVFYYLYLWLVVDLRLIYNSTWQHREFPVFYRGWGFFQEVAVIQGGLVEYLSAFLAQFFYYSWAGAIVVTLQGWLLYILTAAVLRAMNISRFYRMHFIAPILLLILYNRYIYYINITMALSVALIFTLFYVKKRLKNQMLRMVVFFVLSALLYAIAGAASLFFVLLCVIYEWLFRRRLVLALGELLLGAGLVYIEGVVIFDMSVSAAFSALLPVSQEFTLALYNGKCTFVAYGLYLVFPLMVVALWQIGNMVDRFSNAGSTKSKRKKRGKSETKAKTIFLSCFQNNKLRSMSGFCLLLVISGTTAFYSNDKEFRGVLKADYYSNNKMWPETLDITRRHSNNPYMVHLTVRALYHMGRLPYDMFLYPPQNPSVLFMKQDMESEQIDLYFELGLINAAEHLLVDLLEEIGERPLILERLALVKMVKGNINAAKVYLGALNKTLFHHNWANDYLTKLDSDPNLSNDNYIQELRSIMLEKDFIIKYVGIREYLSSLGDKNKYNRMAFEYEMAFYLLKKQLDRFVQKLDQLKDFEYPDIPRSYEEALLVYNHVSKKKIDLSGYRISSEASQSHAHFKQIWGRYGGNRKAAFGELMETHQNSYYFYYVYGPFGIQR